MARIRLVRPDRLESLDEVARRGDRDVHGLHGLNRACVHPRDVGNGVTRGYSIATRLRPPSTLRSPDARVSRCE